MEKKYTIAAVVVTYNRKKLLVECIQSILNQTLQVDKIILIDNNSTDGTYEYMEEKKLLDNKIISYIKLKKNIGGAGGFNAGLKIARENCYDWVWIMDDDTIPQVDCLEKLINANKNVNEKVSFLASCIYGINGEFMNVPVIDDRTEANGYASWYKRLENKMVKIKEATFVSLLINGEAIKKCGLPIKDYFIWGDDTEYTLRLTTNYGEAYLVGDSIAIHKRKNAKHTTLLFDNDKNRIKMYYYMYRNNLINKKLYGGRMTVLKSYIRSLRMTFKIIFSKTNFKFRKILIMHKGIVAYFLKRYDFKAVKNRFNS